MADALGSLGINAGLLIAYVINVLLLLLLLRAVAYKPILNMLESRRERIAEGVNNARRAEEALASAQSDRDALLEEARTEAQRIAAEARTRANEAAEQIEQDARAEARRIVEEARRNAAGEKELALANMRDQIVSLSMAAANHLIGESLPEARQREVVHDFFTALPAEAKDLPAPLEVVTAVPMTDDEQKQAKQALGTQDVTFSTNPAILGGVIVRGEGEQIDASYRAQLDEMQTQLV